MRIESEARVWMWVQRKQGKVEGEVGDDGVDENVRVERLEGLNELCRRAHHCPQAARAGMHGLAASKVTA